MINENKVVLMNFFVLFTGQVFDLTPFLDSDDNIGNDDNDDTDSAMIENGGLSNGKCGIILC
jgi:hypothetical protein